MCFQCDVKLTVLYNYILLYNLANLRYLCSPASYTVTVLNTHLLLNG